MPQEAVQLCRLCWASQLKDSGVPVCILFQGDAEETKRLIPNNLVAVAHPPKFHFRVANERLRKPYPVATSCSKLGTSDPKTDLSKWKL